MRGLILLWVGFFLNLIGLNGCKETATPVDPKSFTWDAPNQAHLADANTIETLGLSRLPKHVFTWDDTLGKHVVVFYLSHSPDSKDELCQKLVLHTEHFTLDKENQQNPLWKLKDKGVACDVAGVDQFVARDINQDGILETAFLYHLSSTGDLSPLTYHLWVHHQTQANVNKKTHQSIHIQGTQPYPLSIESSTEDNTATNTNKTLETKEYVTSFGQKILPKKFKENPVFLQTFADKLWDDFQIKYYGDQWQPLEK